MLNQQPTPPKYLRNDPAAQYLKIGASTLEKLRLTGGGPKFSKLGRIVVYAVADLEAWVASRAVHSTSEADAFPPPRRGR